MPGMKRAANLYLVGLMGAGKTTVGRVLARRLKLRFLDSDQEIERRCGVKIPVIFEIEGEPGFRSREAAVVRHLSQLRRIVLATRGGGGGAQGNPPPPGPGGPRAPPPPPPPPRSQ